MLPRLKIPTTQEVDAELARRDPVVFAREFLGFEPDPWQAQALRWQGGRLILNCCRQSGKSITAAILALHRVLYSPGALALLVSPSLSPNPPMDRDGRREDSGRG